MLLGVGEQRFTVFLFWGEESALFQTQIGQRTYAPKSQWIFKSQAPTFDIGHTCAHKCSLLQVGSGPNLRTSGVLQGFFFTPSIIADDKLD